jgi:cbb3-type cytochrome oxidase subunit 3
MMMPLADLVSSGGLLFAWTLATIILCLLGWLAFTLRQRQYHKDLDE